jgi:hypothetical protein
MVFGGADDAVGLRCVVWHLRIVEVTCLLAKHVYMVHHRSICMVIGSIL